MNCNTNTMSDVAQGESKGYFVSRLEKLIAEEKKNHGLIGFRLFPVANKDNSIDDIAGEVLAMHENYLDGNYTDVTGQEL